MRRKDREIKEYSEIVNVIDACVHCRLGFHDDGEVYIVPMNFGYKDENETITLYFHSAKEGRKVSLLQSNKSVGFQMDTDHTLCTSDMPGECTTRYKSIIGNGVISIIEDATEKTDALNSIMEQCKQKNDWAYPEKMLESVLVFKIVVTKLSCKINA